MLYEIRMPGDDSVSAVNLERDTVTVSNINQQWGRVAYTNGTQIDAPLDVIRTGYDSTFAAATQIIPHRDWSGRFDLGTFALGDSALVNGTDAVKLNWPAATFARYWQDPFYSQSTDPRWSGNVVAGRRDVTGEIYLRNRFYDPATRRFTQEDPIGLAGGLNAYGFTAGDPVNYSDPFGLCPPQDKNYSTCAHGSREWKAGANRSQTNVASTSVNPVVMAGVSVALSPGAGPVVSAGVYEDRYGVGFYFTPGFSVGQNLGITGELGGSTSAAALGGDSQGGCGGILVTICHTSNSNGGTTTVSAGAGTPATAAATSTTTFLSPTAPTPCATSTTSLACRATLGPYTP